MTVKEYLEQLELIDVIIKQKIEEQNSLRIKEASLRSVSGTDEKTESQQECFAELRRKICAAGELIAREMKEYLDKERKIINEIQQLKKPKYVQLLYKKYVQFKKLEDIAAEMNYTYQYTRELHGQALKEFQKYITTNSSSDEEN